MPPVNGTPSPRNPTSQLPNASNSSTYDPPSYVGRLVKGRHPRADQSRRRGTRGCRESDAQRKSQDNQQSFHPPPPKVRQALCPEQRNVRRRIQGSQGSEATHYSFVTPSDCGLRRPSCFVPLQATLTRQRACRDGPARRQAALLKERRRTGQTESFTATRFLPPQGREGLLSPAADFPSPGLSSGASSHPRGECGWCGVGLRLGSKSPPLLITSRGAGRTGLDGYVASSFVAHSMSSKSGFISSSIRSVCSNRSSMFWSSAIAAVSLWLMSSSR